MKRMKMTHGMITVVLLVLCGLPVPEAFADVRKLDWNVKTGGALDAPSNWLINGQKVPPDAFLSDDAIRIRSTQSADMTLDGDLSVGSCALGGTTYGNVSMIWNLGAGRKLSLSTGTVMSLYTNSHLTVTSGTIALNGNALMGNSGGFTDWTLTGSDTAMTCSGNFSIGYVSDGSTVASDYNTFSILDGATYTGGARLGHGGAKNNAAILSGAGSTWTTSSALQLGSNASATHNTIRVSDGATLNGDVTIGATAGATHNTLILSGAGATWTRPDSDILVGCAANDTDYSSLVISNGLSYTTACDVWVGVNSTETHTSEHCRFVLTDKAQAHVANIFAYGVGNGVDIEGNSELFLTDTSDKYLNIGSTSVGGGVWNLRTGGKLALSGTRCNARLYRGSVVNVDGGVFSMSGQMRQGASRAGAADTLICVTNDGTFTVTGTSGLFVGHEIASSNNVFSVCKDGTLSLPDGAPIVVGNKDGYRNRLVVDGGTVTCSSSEIKIGAATNTLFGTAMSGENALIVKNGGSVTCSTLYVGYMSPRSRLEIDNGTVTAETIQASSEISASHLSATYPYVRVAGTTGKMSASGTVTFSESAAVVLDLTALREASAGALVSGKKITFASGATIRVTSSDDPASRPASKTVTALESQSNIDLTGVTIEIDPTSNIRRVNDGNAKTLCFRVRKRSGLTLLVR